MKKFLLALSVGLFMSSCAPAPEDTSVTTFYLIRHAEKDRSEGVGNDPQLTEKGLKRAQRWAKVLGLEPLDAVYSTDYQRTLQTAAPAAEANGLEVSLYDPNAFDAQTWIAQHKGQRVLIVGHSNTTPMLANRLLAEERFANINDAVNGNLYVVTVIGETAGVQLLSIESLKSSF
jgi:2,3-bisphosphoglycerate-dependent phosphoglycerate mutase